MLKIISIEHIEEKKDKRNKTYWRTHVILSDGTEAVGYGKDFDLGQPVVAFFHYGQIKIKHYRP